MTLSLKSLCVAVTAAAAAMLIALPADAAKRKKSTQTKSYEATYYYQGTGTHALRDRARPYFGSPVRGVEFFDSRTSPSE